MNSLPNLAKTATADLVETIGGGSFKASYINWARTMQLLREHAPGWMPELVPNKDGNVLHLAPVGGYLLIRFRNGEQLTPEVPQAIMDTGNKAIPVERITARDITDTHRRGVCMAAAFTFGLAYELWAKMPLETGYQESEAIAPATGVWDGMPEDRVGLIEAAAVTAHEYLDQDDVQGAVDYKQRAGLDGAEEHAAFWTLFKSYERAAMKLAHDGKLEEGIAHLRRNREKQQRKAA